MIVPGLHAHGSSDILNMKIQNKMTPNLRQVNDDGCPVSHGREGRPRRRTYSESGSRVRRYSRRRSFSPDDQSLLRILGQLHENIENGDYRHSRSLHDLSDDVNMLRKRKDFRKHKTGWFGVCPIHGHWADNNNYGRQNIIFNDDIKDVDDSCELSRELTNLTQIKLEPNQPMRNDFSS